MSIIRYHIFADHNDTFVRRIGEAEEIYRELCEEHDDVHLHVEIYANDDDYEDDVHEEHCLQHQGDWPL